jgi:predicted Zn-dependent protease
MNKTWTFLRLFGKPVFWALLVSGAALNACSTNPATGEKQFTALMSPQQESKVGATEHAKIMQEFGAYPDQALQNYVQMIGARVTQNTERPDVQYKFFVLDSPIVNAFALPGGYIYVSRGLLALANSEAELAAVLAHETGHITARHSAERYSQGVLTSLGAAVVSAAVGSDGVSQALGLGSNLYLSSYSRGQENEADSLGLRYMSRGGYDVAAMAGFLGSMQSQSALDSRLAGQGSKTGANYFSTHPATAERVAKTSGEASSYPRGGNLGRDAYLSAISGMIYGDSARQGFVRGNDFYHTEMGFTFSAPSGFRLVNNPAQVIGTSPDGAVIVFDMVPNKAGADPLSYLAKSWMKDEKLQGVEQTSVNGMKAATAAFPGQVGGRPVTIRLVTVQWNATTMARFQVAIPQGADAAAVESLRRATYSLRPLSAQEKQSLRPYRVEIITAKSGDTAATLARRQPLDALSEDRFRVLNGLKPGTDVVVGQRYKLIVS